MPKKAEPNRSTDASCFVRMGKEDRELIERACAALVKAIPGAKLGVGAFMLEAALEKARKVTGEKS